MDIQIVESFQSFPFNLLLNADPDIEKIKAYCQTGKVFIAKMEHATIGVYVLDHTKHIQSAEILNISIADNFQHQGIGKQLITHAIQESKQLNKQKLIVATGNSSISQIAFYQKCGFEMARIHHNYFIEHYKKPIFENGIRCKHQVIFEYQL
jgi:ribosomal protein S18 acetylase RimI-like enzyme